MRISSRRWRSLVIALTLVIVPSLSTAKADPIMIPGYTVTDIGPGSVTFSADANGNGLLNAPNGQVYAFPQATNTGLAPGYGITTNIPLMESAPVNDPNAYGNPANAFAYVQTALMNANGVVAVIEDAGVNGHYGFGTAYIEQRTASGTWSSPIPLWSGNLQFFIEPPIRSNLISGMNNNQVLGSMGTGGQFGDNIDAVLYNLGTHKLTDLNTLFYSTGEWTYNDFSPLALDNDGRILLEATVTSLAAGGRPYQTNLLLTPDGVSSEPLSVPAPEPGTWAVMALAVFGFVAHRRRERRRTR